MIVVKLQRYNPRLVSFQHMTVDVLRIQEIFQYVDPCWSLVSVDGVEHIGWCNDCGLPLLDGQAHHCDESLFIWLEDSSSAAGVASKKAPSPISMLKTYTPDAAPESQYPPATEQPEEECVVGLRADSFESVCQVVTENQVLHAKLAASEHRVKALEEALLEIRSAAIRGIHGDFLDVNVVGIANKALGDTCQR